MGSFDNYLIDIAKQHNKPIVGLETDNLQLEVLDEIEKAWGTEQICWEISFWIPMDEQANLIIYPTKLFLGCWAAAPEV